MFPSCTMIVGIWVDQQTRKTVANLKDVMNLIDVGDTNRTGKAPVASPPFLVFLCVTQPMFVKPRCQFFFYVSLFHLWVLLIYIQKNIERRK